MLTPAVLDALRGAQRVLVLTGSGVSRASGVPTFRDAQTGLWAKFRPEDLATPEAFARDPETVLRWYEERRAMIRAARPNAAHLALALLQRQLPNFTLVTQNVDGLHQTGGSTGIVEFHGNIMRDRCPDHGVVAAVVVDGELPKCPVCEDVVRPDVVWFGEAIPGDALLAATAAAETCDLFFSVGTSAFVYPAADLAQQALRGGAIVIEINPQVTPLSALADHVLRRGAEEVLPEMTAALA